MSGHRGGLDQEAALSMSYEEARAEYFEHLPKPEPTQQWNPLTSTILGRL